MGLHGSKKKIRKQSQEQRSRWFFTMSPAPRPYTLLVGVQAKVVERLPGGHRSNRRNLHGVREISMDGRTFHAVDGSLAQEYSCR